MPSRLGLRPALLRLTLASTMISVGLIFSMLGVVAPPASARASGRISARLATNAFTVAQAGKVRLSYKFSSKSARFRYVLSREQGANWLQVRSTSKRGSFRGSHRMTVRQLFGSKAVKVGQYRVKLSADANSVTLRFRLKQASPAPAPAPVPKPVPAPPAVSSNVVVVTTTADDVNGDVSSVPALNANPGNDGISLREALGAADATGGSATVYVLFSAALNGQTIEVMSELPPIHRDHLVLEGVAPDGSPARVTLDARLAAPATLGELLLVQASHVTVRWLRFTGVNPTGNPTGREAAVVVRQGPNIGVAPSPGPPHIADIQIVDDVFDNRGVNLPPRTQTGPLSDGLLVGTILGAGANTGVSGLTVARNTFANYNDDAVGVWEDSQGTTANGVVIQDNTFDQNEYAIELAEGGNGPSQAGARIIGNTITRGGIGITLNGNATNGTFDDTLIEGNAISGAEGPAINLDAAAFAPGLGSTGSDVISNTQIVNNVIRANSASAFSGIRLAGGNVTSSPPSRISAVTIENNSLVNDGPGSLFVSNPNDAPGVNGNQITDVIVRNSILYDPSGTPILEGAGPVVNQPPDVVMNSLISGPGWAGTNGNITGDPLLVDEPHGDYHLAAGSPAIDAGTTIDAPSDDLDGALRNAQPDIGAFEFGALPRPMLTVTAEELGGSGAVSSSPAAINCGTACGARFDRNTTVTLTATPGSDSAFSGWSGGGCSGTGSCTVMMSSDQTVTATFVPTTHTLTVSRLGGGSGSVAGTGISCPGTCSASYASGTMVTLIATPASGSAFSGWSGGGCNGTGSCTVTMSSDQTVAATFTVPDPSISAFKLTNSRFTVGPHATAIKARASTAAKPRKPKVPQGSAFVYTLSRASTATIVIERRTRGRVVGKKCVARTKANAKKKSCTITTRVGRLTRKSKTGRNTIAFSGRIRRKALAPASYRATITARAGTGPTSKPRSATFTIVHG